MEGRAGRRRVGAERRVGGGKEDGRDDSHPVIRARAADDWKRGGEGEWCRQEDNNGGRRREDVDDGVTS